MAEPVNIHINEGDTFFAHEVTINFTPTQFTFDFKNITPRTDPRSKGRVSFLLKHNVVMTDPWHTKQIVNVLSSVVKRYEEEFGVIKKPKAIEIAEKKQKTMVQKGEKTETPTYLG
ncbi:DUF3467 domain-containing protein [Candidatus Woesearchaeota archaeon]|nr:DUF3467 domain-containing protein [Candidatus Woesearchaeota archaeon]